MKRIFVLLVLAAMSKIMACLKVCDEIEKAMQAGDLGIAWMAVVRLDKMAAELGNASPDFRTACVLVVDKYLGPALAVGAFENAKRALLIVRVLLAEEIPDPALAQSFP